MTTSLRHLRDRVRPVRLAALTALVAVALAVEVVVLGPSDPIGLAVVAVATILLVPAAIEGVGEHPFYGPASGTGLAAIGVLQYVAGEWRLLAALFVLTGVARVVDGFR